MPSSEVEKRAKENAAISQDIQEADDTLENELSEKLSSQLHVTDAKEDLPHPPILMCDAGYGVPKEARPQREKILAIAKQLVNFRSWQAAAASESNLACCALQIVACPSTLIQTALETRMKELWNKQEQPIESTALDHSFVGSEWTSVCARDAVYLSPDASDVLDVTRRPPDVMIVGLLIDRRVQPERSLKRAALLGIRAVRWPLELLSEHKNEPLNVDTVLEGLQQWYWNCQTNGCGSKAFTDAATQALQHHRQRHPQRPRHLSRGQET